jgi:serine/threonine protein kinase
MLKAMRCLSPQQRCALLQGTASADDEPRWIEHLGTCCKCQHELETAAVGDEFSAFDQLPLPLSKDALELVESNKYRSSHASLAGTDGQSSGERVFGEEHLSAPNRSDPLPVLDGFQFVELLGRGGMGAVWKAYESSLDRHVAIKLLASHLASSDLARKRFLQEARSAACVVDDHVVTIHGVDEENGTPYLVMSYIRGKSLEQVLNSGCRLDTNTAIAIARHVGFALRAAHQSGVMHRDVKPGNILIEQNTGRAMLVDFGLARAVDAAALTRTGFVAGTPEYMSPEQIVGTKVDHRTDLYSLGAVLFRALAGRPPFQGETAISVAHQIVHQETPQLQAENPDLPVWLSCLVQRLMSKDVTARFQSADELLETLEKGENSDTACSTRDAPRHRLLGPQSIPMCVGLVALGVLSMAISAGWSNWPTPAQYRDLISAKPSPTSGVEQPSCVVHQPDGSNFTFATFAEAVREAQDGAVVELSDRNKLIWRSGGAIGAKRLTIRAMKGSSPTIRVEAGDSRSDALDINGELILEGLRIELSPRANALAETTCIVARTGSSITLQNCFLIDENSEARNACVRVEGNGRCTFRDTAIVTAPLSAAVHVQPGRRAQVTIQNCLLICRAVVATATDQADQNSNPCSVLLSGNTIRARTCLELSVDKATRKAIATVAITAEQNLIEVWSVETLVVPATGDLAADEATSLHYARTAILWEGDGNLFSIRSDSQRPQWGPAFCRFKSGGLRPLPTRHGPKNLLSWQDFCQSESDRSMLRQVQFAQPRPSRDGLPLSTDAFRWRLSTDALESFVGKDKLRQFGANVDTVGPAQPYHSRLEVR